MDGNTKDPIALSVAAAKRTDNVKPHGQQLKDNKYRAMGGATKAKAPYKRPPVWVRVLRLVGTFAFCGGLCYAEYVWSGQGGAHAAGEEGVWGYVARRARPGQFHVPGVYPLYGLVLLVNVVLTTLLMVFFLGFYIVISGRHKYGYQLPTMYAATDIHALDVEAGGALLSGGDADRARARLATATKYNCAQRAHHQPLESYTSFVALSLLGGLRFPAVTAAWGLLWIAGRVVWARGYVSGTPGNRYRNKLAHGVWMSLMGVLFAAAGTAVGVLAM